MSHCDGTNYGCASRARLHFHHHHESLHICTGKSANSYFVLQESSSSNVKVSTNYIYETLILFLQVFYRYYSTEGHHRADAHEPEGVCTHNGSSSDGKTAGVGATEMAGAPTPTPMPTAAAATNECEQARGGGVRMNTRRAWGLRVSTGGCERAPGGTNAQGDTNERRGVRTSAGGYE